MGGRRTPAATCTTYGVTNEDFGRIAVVDRTHAATNPDAWFYERPITLEDHQASRWVVEPVLRLLDCCQESDGGVALVVTSTERARDLRQPPAVIEAAAQGATYDSEMMTSYYRDDITGLPEMGVVGRPALGAVRPARPTTSRPRSSTTTSRRSCSCSSRSSASADAGEAKDFATVEHLSLGGELPDQHQRRPARRGLHPRHERHHRVRAPDPRHLVQPGRRRRARARHRRHRRADERPDPRTPPDPELGRSLALAVLADSGFADPGLIAAAAPPGGLRSVAAATLDAGSCSARRGSRR